MVFILFISFVILSRIGELILTKRNEKWLLKRGAMEYGKKHYPFMITLHILFFISLIVEYTKQQISSFNLFLTLFYFVLFIIKAWVILSLGTFWTTKIFRIAGIPLIKKGPYKYLKHPNYLIVIVEIAVIPLIFHLYYTAIIFTFLNAMMLFVRITEENKALRI